MRSWSGLWRSTWGIWCSSLAPPDGHLWLPTPRHIEEARRLKDAQQWEAEAKKQRESAARDRLAAAITVDTAEATAVDLIRNHAGDARAFPSFVDQGIGLAASRAAVDQLRPHVKRYHVADRCFATDPGRPHGEALRHVRARAPGCLRASIGRTGPQIPSSNRMRLQSSADDWGRSRGGCTRIPPPSRRVCITRPGAAA